MKLSALAQARSQAECHRPGVSEPLTCWDLWQLEAELGVTRTDRPPEPEGVHNALIDARCHKRIYDGLRRVQSTGSA